MVPSVGGVLLVVALVGAAWAVVWMLRVDLAKQDHIQALVADLRTATELGNVVWTKVDAKPYPHFTAPIGDGGRLTLVPIYWTNQSHYPIDHYKLRGLNALGVTVFDHKISEADAARLLGDSGIERAIHLPGERV